METQLRTDLERHGANVKELLEQCAGFESLIDDLLVMFTQDDNYVQMLDAIELNDVKQAFMNLHTIKGMALNLRLNGLVTKILAIDPFWRKGDHVDDKKKIEAMKKEYVGTIEIIQDWMRRSGKE